MGLVLTILSYRRAYFLGRLLRSLSLQSDPRWSAHIVDLGSGRDLEREIIDAWCGIDRRITARYLEPGAAEFGEAAWSNDELDRVNREHPGEIYCSMCDNAELAPDAVRAVLEWFAANPAHHSGYLWAERDIYSADGLTREGDATMSGHWPNTPPVAGIVFTQPAAVIGQLDHSQVYHRLPSLARWRNPEALNGDRRVDGHYFGELIRLHGPIHPIAPGRVLQYEHLAWRE